MDEINIIDVKNRELRQQEEEEEEENLFFKLDNSINDMEEIINNLYKKKFIDNHETTLFESNFKDDFYLSYSDIKEIKNNKEEQEVINQSILEEVPFMESVCVADIAAGVIEENTEIEEIENLEEIHNKVKVLCNFNIKKSNYKNKILKQKFKQNLENLFTDNQNLRKEEAFLEKKEKELLEREEILNEKEIIKEKEFIEREKILKEKEEQQNIEKEKILIEKNKEKEEFKKKIQNKRKEKIFIDNIQEREIKLKNKEKDLLQKENLLKAKEEIIIKQKKCKNLIQNIKINDINDSNKNNKNLKELNILELARIKLEDKYKE